MARGNWWLAAGFSAASALLAAACSNPDDDAVLFVPNAPALIGKVAISAAVQGMLAAPGVNLGFRETGQVVLVRKKQTDGSWKVIVDANANDK
jgi:ketosteroid isomerase-like protein